MTIKLILFYVSAWVDTEDRKRRGLKLEQVQQALRRNCILEFHNYDVVIKLLHT